MVYPTQTRTGTGLDSNSLYDIAKTTGRSREDLSGDGRQSSQMSFASGARGGAYAYKAMIPLTAKHETIAQTRCLPGKMLTGVEALNLLIFWHTPGPIP